MFIHTKHDKYHCARAEQRRDGVHLFDELGKLIVILATHGAVKSTEGGEVTVVEQPEGTNETPVGKPGQIYMIREDGTPGWVDPPWDKRKDGVK